MARCMEMALDRSGAMPCYVHAHATGTKTGDPAEACAIRRVLGPRLGASVPVSSHKGAVGHGLRVSAFFGLAAAITALKAQAAPPTVGLEDPDPDCPVVHVIGAARHMPIQRVLVNSFGFGGNCASIVLSKVDT